MKYLYRFKFIFIFFLTIVLCLVISVVESNRFDRSIAAESSPNELPSQDQTLEQQGQQFYEQGKYQQAIDQLQQAIELYDNQPLRQAVAYSNLALVYQQLGNWAEANQANNTSLHVLRSMEFVY